MAEQDMKKMMKETFDAVSAGYDGEALRFFRSSAEHMANLLDLRGDEQVLDVACGTGHATLALAPKLSRGRVTSVDLSPGMLDEAQRKAKALGIRNAEFLERDMQDLGFPAASFDAAVCTFGIFFAQDMDAQLGHIASVVRPGGTVLITTFAESYFQPLRDRFFRRMIAYGAPEPPTAWKRVASEDACGRFFEQAGLSGIRVETKNVGYFLKTAEEWWEIVWNAGFRRYVAGLPEKDRDRFQQEHLAEIGQLRTGEGIRLDVPVLFTTGRTAGTR